MQINRFRKNKNGKYTLYLENGETIDVYEDVILKYELLITKKLSEHKKEEILRENERWDTYYQTLKWIEVKARTKREVKEELNRRNYPEEFILDTISKLEAKSYLDDLRYADSYVNKQIFTTSWGPLKIKKQLLRKGICEEKIEEALQLFTEDVEKEKVAKLVSKMIRSNHTKSTSSLKQKIKQVLLEEGFSNHLIQKALAEATFVEDDSLKEREYAKIKKKLERKYQGKELEFQIRKRLYQKGFLLDE